jgi:hypothetical protein
MVFALELFGREIPTSIVVVIAALLCAGYMLANRTSPGPVDYQRRGRMHQCQRCGRNYQPERVEVMADGTERRYFDERCPNCGLQEDSNPQPRFPV